MPTARAVVWIDHHSAQVLHLDAGHVQVEKIKAHAHYTRQHGSSVRSEHEFFGEVCDAMAGSSELIVTGAHTAQADFRHYVDKHRPAVAKLIVSWVTVDHPTEGQLAAVGREYFAGQDRGLARPASG